jgi:hypothetical protein
LPSFDWTEQSLLAILRSKSRHTDLKTCLDLIRPMTPILLITHVILPIHH